MPYSLEELNSYSQKELTNFEWDPYDDYCWNANWCDTDIEMSGVSLLADELQVGDIIVEYNGVDIVALGRIVSIDGWDTSIYGSRTPVFMVKVDTECDNFVNPRNTFFHENAGVTVVRTVDGEYI